MANKVVKAEFSIEETMAVQRARRIILGWGHFNLVQKAEANQLLPILNRVLDKMENATVEGGRQ